MLVGNYRTNDDRYISLMMLQGDRFWPDFCEVVATPEWTTDERFADAAARFNNATECVAAMDEHVRRADVRGVEGRRSTSSSGVWAPVQQANELVDDPQVKANGYVPHVVRDDGVEFDLVANPVQFDEEHLQLVPAPEHGQHTEEILLEMGYDWDAIIAHKESGDIL